MDGHRKYQVSLRGASEKEITRNALLEKVFHERKLRNYAKRSTKSALLIQKIWRRHYTIRTIALQIQDKWVTMVDHYLSSRTKTWISERFLRPFIFFTTHLSSRHQKIQTKDIECIQFCFKILLESINSIDSEKNFCCLATGTLEERKIWYCQVQKLIFICSSIIGKCDNLHKGNLNISIVASMGIRLVLVLTDLKGWKSLTSEKMKDADIAVKNLIHFIGSRRSGVYNCIRKYINGLDFNYSPKISNVAPDYQFLITSSAITLALRPFHNANVDVNIPGSSELRYAAEQYSVLILTIPWLVLRLPPILLPALKHKSVLFPCFKILMILKKEILMEMSSMNSLQISLCSKEIPHVGWALANIICLATEKDNNSSDSGKFTEGLDFALYVHSVIIYSEDFLLWLEKTGWIGKENHEHFFVKISSESIDMHENHKIQGPLNMSYMNLFMPICQQWHLTKLLATLKKDVYIHEVNKSLISLNREVKLELLHIVYFYSNMIRIFSVLNPTVGSLPILNILSFTPGFLVNLWEALENLLFSENADIAYIGNKNSRRCVEDEKLAIKEVSNKWFSIIHKITGKSQVDVGPKDVSSIESKSLQDGESSSDVWDIEPFKHGMQDISKDTSCLLHLFCATYLQLMLVLDDIEFYEKQVPFTLEQQRRISSILNTLVYNCLSHGSGQKNKSLMDVAVKCLHLLYERDCRHQFCPPALWLSPGRKNRLPIAVAARTHEVLSANLCLDNLESVSSMSSVITTTPHVFPFEERVQMFREFIKKDKEFRRMAGEVDGPGRSLAKILIRRGHIVEDGFQQLNSLGSRLKSSIHVSFVSECGLPEAGLDYGGLTKEFLTDITKTAFVPEYGLFSQTLASDGLLIPNTAARFLENGVQMIEFLGRVVGKALYEGILLDYSFSHVFVQKLLGRYSFLDELSTLDPGLYRNLMFVKHFDGDVKELSLDFTTTEESYGQRYIIELKPGGKEVSVTNENKLQYVHAIADYKLNRQLLHLSNAFNRGLTDLISPSWLKLFNATEFNQLLSGGNHDIDIDDLRTNTRYSGGYCGGSRTVKLFWEVIAGFEPKERCLLLKFVTSCSRGPLLGFKYLKPAFTIHKVVCNMPLWATLGGSDVERLPSASTCYNTLKLPAYKRSSILREKIVYAINSNAGFELS